MSGNVADGYGCTFRQIQRYLFGIHPLFEFSHFRMFSSSTKCPGWFHIIIADPFNVSVDNGISELEQHLVAIVLVSFSFLISDGFFDDFLFIQMTTNGFEVAKFELLNDVRFSQDLSKVGKKVFDEYFGRFGVTVRETINSRRPSNA